MGRRFPRQSLLRGTSPPAPEESRAWSRHPRQVRHASLAPSRHPRELQPRELPAEPQHGGAGRHYPSLLGLQADIVFGVLLWEEAARAGEDDFEGTPHVWLRIDKNPIDNTHVAFPADGDNLEYFFECKRLNSYLAEDPLKTKKRLFLGQDTGEEGAGTETVHHNLKVLQTYSFPAHIDKYL